MKYRVAQNPYNQEAAPWTGAIAIEEDDDVLAVPAVVAWTTRGWENPQEIAKLLAAAPALKEALKVAIQVMKIASDWNIPMNYQIEVPPGWEDTLDPDSAEPMWPTLYGVIRKCKEALGDA